jgi:hypothetical protein
MLLYQNLGTSYTQMPLIGRDMSMVNLLFIYEMNNNKNIVEDVTTRVVSMSGIFCLGGGNLGRS